MENDSSYLQRLRFDPKLNTSVIAKYLFNPRLALLFIFAIVGIGLYSLTNLPRVLNPDIKIPIVIVSTVLPGAGPADVESLLTIPIEDGVSNVQKVKKVTSSSRDSVSVVTMEFESGVDPEKARSDTQAAVDSVNNLPTDAQTPRVIKLDFTHAPIWTFALSTSNDTGSLMRYARTLRDKIKNLDSIDDVTISGLEEQEIQIVLKPTTITTYGINPQQLSGVVSTALKSFPAGTISTKNTVFSLSIDQAANSLSDLRNVQVALNGTVVPLSEIADIYERPKPDQNPSLLASKTSTARQVVTFSVYKTAASNIGSAYEDVQKLIDEEPGVKSNQFHVYSEVNSAEEINRQFNDLQRDFLITVILVFLVLFIFLGIKQAIIASLAIPVTFFFTFAVMYMTGIALSFISMFSLLLALGLLVDDTIVVSSAMTAYYRSGKFTPHETGLLVWRDFVVAIFTTTITTVWAFLPLLLASGIIGEFIKSIPIVVSTTLIASFIVAMFVTLPFVVMLLDAKIPYRVTIFLRILLILVLVGSIFTLLPKGNLFMLELLALAVVIFIGYQIRDILGSRIKVWLLKTKQDILSRFGSSNARRTTPSRLQRFFSGRNRSEYINNGVIHFSVISDRYHRVIDGILRSPYKRRTTLIMAIVFSLFSYILLPLGFVKNEFFPKSDQDYVYMTLSLPAGTNVEIARGYATRITNQLRTIQDVSFATADVGQGFSSTDGGTTGSGANDILFTLVLNKPRKLTSTDLGTTLRDKYGDLPDGKVSIVESTGGPPAGSDLQISLYGDDLTTLSGYADQIQNYLSTKPGVVNIDKSIKPGTSKLVFTPDKVKVADAGITTDQLGFWMRLFASGFSGNSVKFASLGSEKEDVTIRMNSLSESPLDIGSLTIPGQGPNAPSHTLASLGTLELKNNPTLITREDGKRTITVSAGVTAGNSISDLNKGLENYADSLSLPSGYSWKTGGVNEENNNSVQSILAAMILSFMLIIVTMVIQFSSFRRALIVMLVIPLSISGVFIIFALTNTPLSFPALIGVLALFGIVVKNAILVVDKIIQNQDAGLGFIESISDAAASRLEAIALTSVATIIGLIPITLSDPIWRGLGGAIIAGLTFSGTIMLFFIPVVYYYWFRSDEAKKSVVTRKTRTTSR